MSPIGAVLGFLLTLFLIFLIVRFLLDLIMTLSRSFRPSGVLVVLFEVVYSVTDPPLRFLRRFIPPLRLGGIALDLSFLLLFIGVQVLRGLVRYL